MAKLKNFLIYITIFFIPFMSVVNVFNITRFNLSLADIFIPIMLVYCIVNIKKIDFKDLSKYILVFVLLFLSILISGIYAINNDNIINGNITTLISEEIKMIICAVYFILIIVNINDKEIFKNALKVWLISSICVFSIGLFALFMYYQGKPIEINTLVTGARSVNVFIGTFTDQNLAGVYLSISFYIALFYLKISEYKYEKVLAVIVMIVSPICIFLTVSRGAMIGFSCSLVFYVIIAFRHLYKKLIIIVPSILLIVMFVMMMDIAFMNQNTSNSLFHKLNQVTTKSGEFTVRGNLSKVAFQMGNDHFLLGVGRGNYQLNSPEYFKELGLDANSWDYKDKIPHNTILGIYAELGLVGLVLYGFVFIYLLYLIIKNIQYKDYRGYQYILIAMYACIFAESIPLNLENFRGLWAITALFIVLQKNLVQYLIPIKEKEFKLSYKYVCLGAIILIATGFLYFENARKLNISKDILVDNIISIPIEKFENNKEQYIKYFVNTSSDSPENISANISVVATDFNNNEKILAEYDYWKASGNAKLYFEPDETIQSIVLRLKNINKTQNLVVRDIKLGIDNIEKTIINTYPLLTDSMYEFFSDKNLIVHTQKNSVTQNQSIWDKDLNYNFSDKIILKSVSNKLIDGKYKVIFTFDCIGKMDYDYMMWMHASVDNINYLDADRIQYGFDNFDHAMEVPMSTWEIGKEYTHEFILPIQKGIYNFTFGFLFDLNRLYIDNIQTKASLYIGEIDTKR